MNVTLIEITWYGRTKWVEHGDANTKYFQSIATARKNHNSIWALKDDEDIWVEDEDKLKELGIRYISEIFKDDGKENISDQLKFIQLFPSLISREDADVFTSEVTLAEVEGDLKAF